MWTKRCSLFFYVYEHRKRLVFIKRTRERLNEARAFYNCCKTLPIWLDRSKLKKKKKINIRHCDCLEKKKEQENWFFMRNYMTIIWEYQ